MKILLFGKNGQLGWELQRSLVPLGELVALDRRGAEGLNGDLADLDGLRRTIRAVKPDWIVNAAAYTAVDKAEEEGDLAELINGEAPAVMAREAASLGCGLLHYSTDYVFDGTGNWPWSETDPVAPVNQYGMSKLKGEQAVVRSGCRHLIFRTSWVYGTYGRNFLGTMLRLMRTRDTIRVVVDQVGVPAGTELIADVSAHALKEVARRPELQGLYHLVPTGEASWHEYAVFIAETARACGLPLLIETVEPISTDQYPTAATRPLNSRLSTAKIKHCFGLTLPRWQDGVERAVREIVMGRDDTI